MTSTSVRPAQGRNRGGGFLTSNKLKFALFVAGIVCLVWYWKNNESPTSSSKIAAAKHQQTVTLVQQNQPPKVSNSTLSQAAVENFKNDDASNKKANDDDDNEYSDARDKDYPADNKRRIVDQGDDDYDAKDKRKKGGYGAKKDAVYDDGGNDDDDDADVEKVPTDQRDDNDDRSDDYGDDDAQLADQKDFKGRKSSVRQKNEDGVVEKERSGHRGGKDNQDDDNDDDDKDNDDDKPENALPKIRKGQPKQDDNKVDKEDADGNGPTGRQSEPKTVGQKDAERTRQGAGEKDADKNDDKDDDVDDEYENKGQNDGKYPDVEESKQNLTARAKPTGNEKRNAGDGGTQLKNATVTSALKFASQQKETNRIFPGEEKHRPNLSGDLQHAGSSAETVPKQTQDDDERYVAFAVNMTDSRGFGAQLFDMAAIVYVAELSGRRPALLNYKRTLLIDTAFAMNVRRLEDTPLLQSRQRYDESPSNSLRYDPGFDAFARRVVVAAAGGGDESAAARVALLNGYFQSWRYAAKVQNQLRKLLAFRPEIQQFVRKFFADNAAPPPTWTNEKFVRVGIHVRRGDVVEKYNVEWGYDPPPDGYFQRAMMYFTERYGRVLFVVVSDDVDWCRQHIVVAKAADAAKASATFSERNSVAQDMALLANCDHVIMSVGTFGWWGGWLANGTTVYYNKSPRPGSALASKFSAGDHFPPGWIGMS